MALFVTVLLLSNLLSSAKIIDTGWSLGPLDILFDAGTLVFPISYIFGDVLTEVYGYKRARRVIWTGFAAMALMGLFVWVVGILPGESGWREDVGQEAYNSILGGISGLVVASLTAYLIGEFLNSYVMAKMKVFDQGDWLVRRTIGSTLVGQAADTSIFFAIATLLGVFEPSLLLALIGTNYLFKVAIEIMFTPLTVRVVNTLKAVENEDYFDRETDFNPFSIRV
ncbi:MAG: queuosine precursor transporter [Chloroflexi bacterium]|nr:queuosine precursor transporter [Chloroflexota bacterium]